MSKGLSSASTSHDSSTSASTSTSSHDSVRPLLKWVGGKTQLLGHIEQQLPSEMDTYHEPFVGGASVLLRVLSLWKRGRIVIRGEVRASDSNAALIEFYRHVQSSDALERLYLLVTEHFATFDSLPVVPTKQANRRPRDEAQARSSRESYYYWVRSEFNRLGLGRDDEQRSAALWFLNKTCFRGIYREGPKGFNVPYGNPKATPGIPSLDEVRQVSELLSGVVFECEDFGGSVARCAHGDFLFLDPPYYPVSETSFVQYNAGGFSLDDHERLFSCLRELREKGNGFLLCNSRVPWVTEQVELLGGCQVHELQARRAIHSKKPNSVATEVLVCSASSSTSASASSSACALPKGLKKKKEEEKKEEKKKEEKKKEEKRKEEKKKEEKKKEEKKKEEKKEE